MIDRKIWTAFRYLQYLIGAKSRFRVHSPYVFKLYTEIIRDKQDRDIFQAIERQRKSLLRQRSLLETTDFGSGASDREYKTRFRQVKEVTRHASISPKFGKLIHRLVEYARPEEILEIANDILNENQLSSLTYI